MWSRWGDGGEGVSRWHEHVDAAVLKRMNLQLKNRKLEGKSLNETQRKNEKVLSARIQCLGVRHQPSSLCNVQLLNVKIAKVATADITVLVR